MSRSFFTALRSRLKRSQVHDEMGHGLDTSGFARGYRGIVFAENEADVLFILKTAARFKIGLSPVSTGLNAGYGDFYPQKSANVILHLGRMTRILELNREEGWLRVEPGVTQEQVVEFLRRKAPEFHFERTFWLNESSVLGNALERGRTLFGERERLLIGTRLALSSGKILRTGFDPQSPSPLSQGMNLHPLIFQSNLGVAVEGILKLEKINPREIYCSVSTPSFHQGLRRIAELERSGIEPLRLLRWYDADSSSGQLVLAADRADERKLRALGARRVRREDLAGSAPLEELQEHGAFGFFTFSVRLSSGPFRGARAVVKDIRKLCRHCVLTVSFLENSAVFLLRAHCDPTLHDSIRRLISAAGYVPYRGHSARKPDTAPAVDLKKRIKKTFDPKNVISPGKYGLL